MARMIALPGGWQYDADAWEISFREMLAGMRADRERLEALPKPVRRAPRIDDPDYLDGDYARVGSYSATRWGR